MYPLPSPKSVLFICLVDAIWTVRCAWDVDVVLRTQKTRFTFPNTACRHCISRAPIACMRKVPCGGFASQHDSPVRPRASGYLELRRGLPCTGVLELEIAGAPLGVLPPCFTCVRSEGPARWWVIIGLVDLWSHVCAKYNQNHCIKFLTVDVTPILR